jgi:hypothetical protein
MESCPRHLLKMPLPLLRQYINTEVKINLNNAEKNPLKYYALPFLSESMNMTSIKG